MEQCLFYVSSRVMFSQVWMCGVQERSQKLETNFWKKTWISMNVKFISFHLTDRRDYNLIKQKYIKIVLYKGQSIVNNFFLETWSLVNMTAKLHHLMSESHLVRQCDHKCRMEAETWGKITALFGNETTIFLPRMDTFSEY